MHPLFHRLIYRQLTSVIATLPNIIMHVLCMLYTNLFRHRSLENLASPQIITAASDIALK